MAAVRGVWSGSAPILKKFKASATGYVPGMIMCRSAANASGQMSVCTTTDCTNSIGVLQDNGEWKDGTTVTYSTTQGATEAVFTVLINPDAIIRYPIVTGATGSAISVDTIVTASSNGLTAVGGTSVASPDLDEGILWYITGANVGQSRKITSTSSVTATFLVPFAGNAVGDTYTYSGMNLGLQEAVTLSTDLQKALTGTAGSSALDVVVFDMELNGTTNSYVSVLQSDSTWNQVT